MAWVSSSTQHVQGQSCQPTVAGSPCEAPGAAGSGNSSATVAVEAEIDRSLWGLSWGKMGSGLKNQIAIPAYFDRI